MLPSTSRKWYKNYNLKKNKKNKHAMRSISDSQVTLKLQR